jgi:hypothetical protein
VRPSARSSSAIRRRCSLARERSRPPASRSWGRLQRPIAPAAQQRLGDLVFAAQLGDAALAAQTGHHQLQRLLGRELAVLASYLAQRQLLVVERPIL